MDKSSTKGQHEQVQAIYLAQANIFSYEARKSAKSWVPLCDSAVPISILYDNTRSIYRIISVDAEIKEVVVNTTILPELEFVKTTQKFGYWKDVASGRVFGIGFASEYEAEAFDECLKKVKSNLGPPSVHSSMSLNGSESTVIDEAKVSASPYQQHRLLPPDNPALQGQGDGQHQAHHHLLHQQQGTKIEPGTGKKLNWDDYEQIAPTVLGLLQGNRHQNTLAPPVINNNNVSHPERPSTYKVDLPVITSSIKITPSPAGGGSTQAPPPPIPPARPQQIPQQQPASAKLHHHFPNMEEIRMHPPPTYHIPPASYYAHHQQQHNPGAGTPMDAGAGSQGCGPMMALSVPMPHHHASLNAQQHVTHGYCYQGPPGATQSSDPGAKPTQATSATCFDRRTAADLVEEVNRLRAENVKLSQSLIESTCAAKKWEVQVNSLRDDNIQLVKSVADLNSKVESLSKEVRENKEQASRWKDHYQQAVSSAKEKGKHLKDVEDKLKSTSADKTRIESVMKDLEEELKRQQQINKEQQHANSGHVVAGQYTNKYFKELEDHYRKLLSDSQKRIEEILRKDTDRKNVLRGVDTLFTGAIQGLINIHGQIRQSYEQQ